MKYKLIAADMDGTLLKGGGDVDEGTIAAIKEAVASGVIFTVSTGRPVQGVEKYAQQLGLTAPVIAYNGAMIVRLDPRETLFSKTLLPSDALRILDMGYDLGLTMCVWARHRLYCNVLNDRTARYQTLSNVTPKLIADRRALGDEGITKIVWYDDLDVIAKLQEGLRDVRFENATYCTTQPNFLEFFSGEASKARALGRIGELYGVKRKEMIAIGDGYNDLPMIEYVGLGVAMANAPAALKEKAKYVTERSNDEDGVGEVIRKFVL